MELQIYGGVLRMSIEGHVQALRAKHEDLEARIHEAENNLGVDDLEISELKKEKLRVKDELHKLGVED